MLVLMKLWVAVFVTLGLANTYAIARKLTPCVDFLGNSPMIGPACKNPGVYNDQTANRPGDITKLNLYFNGSCITGVKPTYGFDSRDAKLLGTSKGTERSLKFPARDQITGFEYAGNSCLQFLNITLASNKSIAIGKPRAGSTVKTMTGPALGAYVWAFRGWQEASKLCQFQVIWVRSSCDAVVSAGTKQPQEPVTKPQNITVKVPIPVPVPTPVPVPVPTPVNVTVKVPTPVPVLIPTPVPIPTPVNVSVPVPTPVPTPVPVLVPVPVPVVASNAPAAFIGPSPSVCPKGSTLQTLKSNPNTSMCVLVRKNDMTGVLYTTGDVPTGGAIKTRVKCWSVSCNAQTAEPPSTAETDSQLQQPTRIPPVPGYTPLGVQGPTGTSQSPGTNVVTDVEVTEEIGPVILATYGSRGKVRTVITYVEPKAPANNGRRLLEKSASTLSVQSHAGGILTGDVAVAGSQQHGQLLIPDDLSQLLINGPASGSSSSSSSSRSSSSSTASSISHYGEGVQGTVEMPNSRRLSSVDGATATDQERIIYVAKCYQLCTVSQ